MNVRTGTRPNKWFCEAHRLWVSTDCPRCDDEQIALLEQYAKECHVCGRGFRAGELAWASDWKVVEPGGVRAETRYTCDDCEAVT